MALFSLQHIIITFIIALSILLDWWVGFTKVLKHQSLQISVQYDNQLVQWISIICIPYSRNLLWEEMFVNYMICSQQKYLQFLIVVPQQEINRKYVYGSKCFWDHKFYKIKRLIINSSNTVYINNITHMNTHMCTRTHTCTSTWTHTRVHTHSLVHIVVICAVIVGSVTLIHKYIHTVTM